MQMFPPDSPPQACSPRGLWPQGLLSCSYVSPEEKESCDCVLKSGYSLPIGRAALTGNGSPCLASHRQSARENENVNKHLIYRH